MCSSQYLYESILSQILLCALHGLYFINLPPKSFQTCLPLGPLYSKLSKCIELSFCETAPCLLIALILWENRCGGQDSILSLSRKGPVCKSTAMDLRKVRYTTSKQNCRRWLQGSLTESAFLMWGAEPLPGWRLLCHQGFQNNKVRRTETLYLLESL